MYFWIDTKKKKTFGIFILRNIVWETSWEKEMKNSFLIQFMKKPPNCSSLLSLYISNTFSFSMWSDPNQQSWANRVRYETVFEEACTTFWVLILWRKKPRIWRTIPFWSYLNTPVNSVGKQSLNPQRWL
jgi:hypothetical protein